MIGKLVFFCIVLVVFLAVSFYMENSRKNDKTGKRFSK